MKKLKRLLKIATVLAIVAMMTIPLSAFGANLKQTGNAWYNVNNVSAEMFTVDGNTAYCVEPGSPIPPNGNYKEEEINNANLLKVLYYGYGGPGFNNTIKAKMDSYHNNQNITATGTDLYYCFTHKCAAKAYGSSYKFSWYTDWNNAIDSVYSYLTSMDTPKGCKAYVINKGTYSQTIAYLIKDKEIKLQIHKRSANTGISDGNNCYSLEGAVYGIYTDAKCTQKLGEITTNANGYADYPTSVPSDKTYYAKELKVPKGYALSNEILEFKDVGNISKVSGLNIHMAYPYDTPKNDPVRVVVKKTDSNGNPLANAEFTVNYYRNYYTEETVKGMSPMRSWVIKTDKDGDAFLTSDYLVTGDEFYMTTTGNPCLPLGTVTIQETKAPGGYKIDNTIHTFQITEDGSAADSEFVTAFNAPEVSNTPYGLTLEKKDADGKMLSGAHVQILDMDKNVIKDWVTTQNPYVVSSGLTFGEKYIYHEFKAPDGYVRAKDIVFTFDGDLTLTMTDLKTETSIKKTDITGEKELAGAKLTLTDEKGNVVEEWTSTTSAHLIKGLVAGKKYTLTETIAPDGYSVADPVTFTVKSDGSVTEVVMKDELTETQVSKTNITGDKELAGAKLKVVDSKGKTVDEWTSTEKAHVIKGLVAGKTYTLIETLAPEGYAIAKDVAFTVKGDGSVTKVVMKDELTETHVTKTNITGDKELSGATLRVIDSDNKKIDEWVSTNTPHVIKGLVAGKTYTLIETIAPAGYSVTQNVKFTVKGDGSVTKVVMKDDLTVTEVTKTDITGEKEIAGAKMELTDSKGKVIESWTSTNKAHEIKGLVAGKSYTLTEVEAPAGYTIAAPINFTVNADGSVTKVIMKDELTVTKITKTDITGEKEIEGAKLTLTDSDGKIIDSWTSTTKAHEIKGLVAGKSYTLTEVEAPAGYTIVAPITFTVRTDGKPTTVTLKNAETVTKITKTDITGEKELAGAQLKVVDGDGNVIDEWTSTTTAHEIKGLVAGSTYTLIETAAPNGYAIAKSVKFTVNSDGTVTEVVMKDELTVTRIHKTDITGEKELAGARLKVVDSDGKTVDEWTSTTTAHEIKGLIAGKTYTLVETIAPKGYSIAKNVSFTVKGDGSVTEVIMKDDLTVTRVTKTDITGEKELEGAQLKVVDSNGNVIDEWTSTTKAHDIKGLVAGSTYTLIETISPEGYSIAKSIDFTVKSNGSVTYVTMKDELTVTVISKKAITGEDELPGATLQITDSDGNVVDEWISTTEPHEIKGLVAGKTYKLIETIAPAGYAIASPDEFTVKDDGTTTEIVLRNDLTVTTVSKTDITGEKELPGAKLQVIDEDGNVVDEWESGEEPHEIRGLVSGKTYKLVETISPDGYTVANTVEFTVDENGQPTFVQMKDDVTRYSFIKVDEDNKPIKGAKLQLFDEKGTLIDEWTTDGTPHVIEGKLVVGKKYILHEAEAPEGYEKAEDITFEVENTSEMKTLTMVDKYKGDVKISTPDQPVIPNVGQGGSFVQTGEAFPAIILGVFIAAAFAIFLFRKRKENF